MRLNKEKLKGALDKVKTSVGKISKKIWIILAAAVVLVVAGIIVFSETQPYSTLITGASAEETATVMSWLDSQGYTDYQVEGTGTILVPDSKVANLKARLLQEQYATSNARFSAYFGQISPLSTQSEREKTWLTALMEDLSNTISSFEGVQEAVVNIDLGEDRTYVLDSSNVLDATAGVKLTMREGQILSDTQANAIRNYLAHCVAGLSIDNVFITDTWGNSYNSFGTVSYGKDSSALKLQLEQQWSNIIRTHIMQLLVPMYGEENVTCAVNCIVEVGESTIEDYEVRLPENAVWSSSGGAGIIGQRVYSYGLIASDDALAQGLVGTADNSELPQYVEQEPGEDDYDGREEGSGSLDYDNSKTKTYTVRTAGYITDCTVSVVINSTTAGIVDEDTVRSLVSTAAGITAVASEEMSGAEYLASKITVVGQPFYERPEDAPNPDDNPDIGMTFDKLPLWVIIAAAGTLLLIIILTVVLLLLRKKRRKKKAEEQKEVEKLLDSILSPNPGEPVAPNVMDIHTERSMELRQGIREYVDENMEVAALLVKAWLKEDDDNG
ncbi:MAG: hypothetical protein NC319_01740 [Butyricicoccus sp.]|nr:hypothetical protein [Butyricicoccus sp.]